MPSVHKYSPIAYRPPVDVREPLMAEAARTGRAVSAIISDALRAHLARAENPGTAENLNRD